jgi:micrococcal nuclease
MKKEKGSYNKKSIIIIVIVVISLFLFLTFCSSCSLLSFLTGYNSDQNTSNGQIKGEITQDVPLQQNEEIKLYTVTNIIDGDTIKILYEENIEKVRLIGIDTPEEANCFFEESTERLRSLLEDKKIRIEFDPSQDQRDKYDRLLLYIWLDDTFINQAMISDGYAHEYTYNLPYKYQDDFKQAENSAREAKRGLWGDICDCTENEIIDTECIGCNLAKITKYRKDCKTFTEEISDNTCTNDCPVYTPPPSQPPPVPTPTPTPTPTYTCNCNKTCKEMSSCDEAYYQLNTCGCNVRDGDNDGVPCENICPGG